MKKNKYLFNTICVSLFIAFFVWLYVSTNSDDRSLINNKVISYGDIQYVDYFPRGAGLYVYYEFKVNGKVYKDREHLFVEKDNINRVKRILEDKLVPIVYDSTNIENNEMLFSKEAYISFGLIRHDSLNNIYLALDSLRYGDR